MSNVNELVVSAVRVGVSAGVGYGVNLLAKYGLHVNSAAVDGVVQGVVTMGYYTVVNWLEQYYSKAGWLLGVRKAVKYVETHDTPAPAAK